MAPGGTTAAITATNWNIVILVTPAQKTELVRDIQRPLAELTVPKASEVKVWLSLEGEVLQMPATATVEQSELDV